MAVKTPSALIAEMEEFARNIAPTTEYTALLSTALEAGYRTRLVQKSADIAANGASLVTFDIMVGKADEPLEFYDTVSIAIEPGQTSVSLAARVRAVTTLIFLFFGRLPPAPSAPTQEHNIDMSQANGHDVVLPDTASAPEAEDRDFPTPPPFVPEEPLKLELVARREPDGVPIFVDLYAMDGDLAGVEPKDIVKELIDVMETFIKRAESAAQILAIYDKNPDVMPFLQDFGTEADRAGLAAVSKRKHAQLSTPPVMTNQPKRRSPASARGN